MHKSKKGRNSVKIVTEFFEKLMWSSTSCTDVPDIMILAQAILQIFC